MARKEPPAGLITAKQAAEILGVSDAMLSIYVKQGKLHRRGPETRKHKFYIEAEVREFARKEKEFFEGQEPENLDASFALATPDDMDGLVTLAERLFTHTISADRRREWLSKEQRGNYVMRRQNGSIAAYCYLQPLKHDRLVAYMKRKIRGWDITADDIEPFEPGKPAEVMIGGIGRDPDAHPSLQFNYVNWLLFGVARDMARLASQGITISKLYAYSTTLEGIVMCLDLEMQQWARPLPLENGEHCCTFVLDVEQSSTFLLQPYKQSFQQWREQHLEPQKQAMKPLAEEIHVETQTPQRKRLTEANMAMANELPIGLVGWRDFAKQHNIPETTVQKAIRVGRLNVIEGKWKVGRTYVQGALDEAGRKRFFELWPHAAKQE